VAGKRAPGATRADVLPLPAGSRPARKRQQSWLPSIRSLGVGALVVLAAGGAYLIARETSLFAVRTIEVRGASPALAAKVRSALAPIMGSSLVGFDAGAAERHLAGLPEVAAASYDRAFPHTLRVFVRPERAVAIARRGPEAWLVSARARVLRTLESKAYPNLPRLWLAASTDVSPGQTLAGSPAQAARVLGAAAGRRLPGTVRTVRADESELTLVLASGMEIRLGDPSSLALKLEVARRIVPRAPGACYLDVSVPGRSVAGYQCRRSSRG
jgi:cell division protein FtsQ